ncbi:MAG: hypothetical protein IJJ15_00660, partial [Ruminococcus sp.]|nr:hypothetical protein [Ruminococcus sp.]
TPLGFAHLSLSENGNPFVGFADISPIRGISCQGSLIVPSLPYSLGEVAALRLTEGTYHLFDQRE